MQFLYSFFEVPVWVMVLALYIIWIGMVYILRDIFEGFPYNVAYSSQIGDMALVGVVLIGATVYQRAGGSADRYSESVAFYGSLMAAVFATAYFLCAAPGGWKHMAIADQYHHFVVAPTLVFYVISSLVIVNKDAKNPEESMGCYVLLVIWLMCVCFDALHGRLDQRTWVGKQGVKLE